MFLVPIMLLRNNKIYIITYLDHIHLILEHYFGDISGDEPLDPYLLIFKPKNKS